MARWYHARLALVSLALLVGPVAIAQAQKGEEEIDRKPVTCVTVGRIDRSVGASNRTVVLFMRGGQIFRNDLVNSCAALTKGETQLIYNYRVGSAKITRLCGDSFSVDNKPGLECVLGKYVPITQAEADQLLGTAPAPAPAAAPPATTN
jgi:hypothetical protein